MWHSTIFGPYFVVGAIYSGIAAIIVVAAILRKVYHLEEYLQPIHFNNLGLLLLTMALLWFYFTLAEYLTTLYGGSADELAVFWVKLTGKYSPMFWLMVLLCFIIPFPILAMKRTRTILGTSIASVSVLIGMWLERFLIIIPTLSQPRLPYERGSYMPSWVEWSMMGGLSAGFILAIVLFSKFFPVISIWEMEKEEKERGENKRRMF
jgi:molybdopterin-containing oxidoreductase family membrane subunit